MGGFVVDGLHLVRDGFGLDSLEQVVEELGDLLMGMMTVAFFAIPAVFAVFAVAVFLAHHLL